MLISLFMLILSVYIYLFN